MKNQIQYSVSKLHLSVSKSYYEEKKKAFVTQSFNKIFLFVETKHMSSNCLQIDFAKRMTACYTMSIQTYNSKVFK